MVSVGIEKYSGRVAHVCLYLFLGVSTGLNNISYSNNYSKAGSGVSMTHHFLKKCIIGFISVHSFSDG